MLFVVVFPSTAMTIEGLTVVGPFQDEASALHYDLPGYMGKYILGLEDPSQLLLLTRRLADKEYRIVYNTKAQLLLTHSATHHLSTATTCLPAVTTSALPQSAETRNKTTMTAESHRMESRQRRTY